MIVRLFSYKVDVYVANVLSDYITGLGGGRVVRWCWVNFQCRSVLLIWIIVGQGPIALAIGTGGGLFGHFSLIYHLFSFSLFLEGGPI